MPSPDLQKRHFAAIASAVHNAAERVRARGSDPEPMLSAVTAELKIILFAYNSAFNGHRFEEACRTGVHHKTALHRARRGV